MEQRLANASHLTLNQKKFIETALLADLRADGRRPFDYRNLTVKFGKDEGSAEVQLGQTHVMAIVTAQLVQPYRDRPNDGTLSIFTEFSPMADPSFEPGRPGENAVELGRVIDRGLRESRAVDTESLCVLSGKLVWAIRVDLHILDNGGNLIDAANIAALAALLTFRRPEISLGGEDGQEVIVHPPEEREPLHLIIHHLPIAVTFAFFSYESSVVIDPTHEEEAFIGGRMTATINANGDVCAIQKAGGEGVLQSVIMQCLRIASVKAGAMTEKIKKAVDSYNTERVLEAESLDEKLPPKGKKPPPEHKPPHNEQNTGRRLLEAESLDEKLPPKGKKPPPPKGKKPPPEHKPPHNEQNNGRRLLEAESLDGKLPPKGKKPPPEHKPPHNEQNNGRRLLEAESLDEKLPPKGKKPPPPKGKKPPPEHKPPHNEPNTGRRLLEAESLDGKLPPKEKKPKPPPIGKPPTPLEHNDDGDHKPFPEHDPKPKPVEQPPKGKGDKPPKGKGDEPPHHDRHLEENVVEEGRDSDHKPPRKLKPPTGTGKKPPTRPVKPPQKPPHKPPFPN